MPRKKTPVMWLLPPPDDDPMVFCIFPALFVVVLGPAAITFLDGF